MHIGCCEKCRYVDLIENLEGGCPRCRGQMIPLGIDTAEWNLMSPVAQDLAITRMLTEIKNRPPEPEPEPEPEPLAQPEPEIAEPGLTEDKPSETGEDVSDQNPQQQPKPEQDEEEHNIQERSDWGPLWPESDGFVYVCYKCSNIDIHDGQKDRYFCTECGAQMVETGCRPYEWANLPGDEKRGITENARIRHMVTAIKQASADESEDAKTQSIIDVVGNDI